MHKLLNVLKVYRLFKCFMQESTNGKTYIFVRKSNAYIQKSVELIKFYNSSLKKHNSVSFNF